MNSPIKIFSLISFIFLINCNNNNYIQLTGETMGTSYLIKIVNQSNNIIDTNRLKGSVDSLLMEINHLFSTYILDSELTEFNNREITVPIKISDEFLELYNKATNITDISNKSFDFTIFPIVNLWGFGPDFHTSNLPDSKDIEEKLKITGTENLILENGSIRKLNKYTKIDFSAIAKGWGVDKVSLWLEGQNIENYMVEIGGEIRVAGKNINNSNWNIGISIPEDVKIDLFKTINITDIGIATSGSYNNYFTKDNINYTHLIDPKTGYPIKHDLVSATITASDCATADGVATAVMVKGFQEGLNWVNSLPNIECLLIRKNDEGDYIAGQSSGFNYEH